MSPFCKKIGLVALQQLTLTFCVQFIFTPQNTVINQPAVYKCTVDTNGVTVQWTVNGNSSTSSSITSLGIVTQGVGTQSSTLTIPGEDTLNGTEVTCIASGLVNGKGYFNTSSDVLYIQGLPGPPFVTCSSINMYNIRCNWTAPYTIAGVEIRKYNYNITRGLDYIIQEQVADTEVIYIKGTYNLSVAAVIGDKLMGDVHTTSMNDTDIPCFYSFTFAVENQGNKWMANFTIKVTDVEQFSKVQPAMMTVTACPTDSSLVCDYYMTNITSEEMNSTELVQTIELRNNVKRNFSISMNYTSGLNIISNYHPFVSTFDVQGLDVTEVNSSTGEVCFRCSYDSGSSAKGCFIRYNSLQFSDSLLISITEDSKCVPGFITGDYSISVYDQESDGTVFTSRPAIQTATRIEGIPASTSTSSTGSISSSSSSLPSSLSHNSPLPSPTNTATITVLVAVSVTGSIVLITLLVAAVFLAFCIIGRAKTNCKHVHPNQSDHDVEIEVQSNHPMYLETVIDPNGPKPPLSTANASSYPYSDIQHIHNNNDIYNKLNENTRQSMAVSSNPPVYSTLQKNNGANGYSILPGLVNDDTKTPLNCIDVKSLVVPISYKWEQFGAALPITPNKLNKIREKHPDDDHSAFCDVIQEWQISQIRSFTTETLKMVLTRIGESGLLEHSEL